MSVVGFDFGNMNSVIAVAQKGGIDIIANEVSNRETPTMVGFGQKERFAGEAAQSQFMFNFRNTITDIKRLVGRKWNEPEVQEELKRLPFKTKELPEGRIGVEVNYAGETQTFSVEQVLAVLFQKLKKTSEMNTSAKVVDVVISVPVYFTNFQRRAVKDAAAIAGLNVLRLINEPTATGLAYGFFKNLADNEVLKVLFYDMGQSATTAAVVQFEKSKMKVLGVAWDRNLGGRNFDEALVDHFAAEFKTKYNLDVKSNPKALLRLRVACEKLKKTLSANSEAPLNIDSLMMNDVDVKAMMNRDEFEKIVTSLLDRAVLPIKKVLEDTGVTLEQLHALEIVGMGTRLLSLQKRLTAVLGRELSKTTNAAEAVAKGAALMCATLSPVFKINKQFKIIDISPFPVQLVVNSLNPSAMETSEETMEIFTRNNQVTSAKDISFYRKASAPFELNTFYPNLENLPPGTDAAIAKFQITNIPATPNGEEAKVEVRVKLDGSCFVNVEHAHALETYEETVVETPATPATPPTPSTPTTPAENKSEEAPATPTAEPQTPPAQPAEAQTKKVKKVRRHQVKVASHFFGAMSAQELQNAIDAECRMVAQDKLAWETAEKKNQLESYIYDMRERINGAWKAYFTEKEAETLTKQLQEAEDWLYGDGEDVTKSVYAGKLDSLKAIGDKGALRYRESEERPSALKELNAALETYRNFAASTDAKYEHIEKADRDKVIAECDATEKAINDQLASQNSSPKNVDPVLTAADILRKRDALERFCKPIVNKPKPTPPPKPAEPTPAPAPAADANAGAAPEQPKENGAKAGENMDTSS